MKAAAVDRFGPPSALTLHDVPVPRPGPHEVLIAIDTAGIGSWNASMGKAAQAHRRLIENACWDQHIVDVEVYFGWSVPHKAPQGGFVNEAGSG